tara:strand:- start:585 stop:1040 length:456 start_codon:yes stop_codon:yes gene_type:complete
MFETVLHFTPVAMGRPRVTVRGRQAHAYLPKKTKAYLDTCTAVLRSQWKEEPYAGPVAVYLIFVHPRPLRLLRKRDPAGRIFKASKPDLDNLTKMANDIIVRAGVIVDDNQIVLIEARDFYGDRGEKGKTEIEVVSCSWDSQRVVSCGNEL